MRRIWGTLSETAAACPDSKRHPRFVQAWKINPRIFGLIVGLAFECDGWSPPGRSCSMRRTNMPSTVYDSVIFKDSFGTPEMRAVFSDESYVANAVAVEVALARVQGHLGLIPRDAA